MVLSKVAILHVVEENEDTAKEQLEQAQEFLTRALSHSRRTAAKLRSLPRSNGASKQSKRFSGGVGSLAASEGASR